MMKKGLAAEDSLSVEVELPKLVSSPARLQKHATRREMNRRQAAAATLESLLWHSIILGLVLVDMVVFVIDLSVERASRVADLISLVIVFLLCAEWLIRWATYGHSFLRLPLTWVDFAASFGSLGVQAWLVAEETLTSDTSKYASLILAARLLRGGRAVCLVASKKIAVVRATRRLVSENRRRFRDAEYDLDLTYITDRVIAMSLPAHKAKDALYRNALPEVASYFEARHAGHYKVFNVTSERRYDASLFRGRVQTLAIDDHNPAPILQLADLTRSVSSYLDSDSSNVVAVHCKGGKGRTGTAICCYLLSAGAFRDPQRCLDYYARPHRH